MGCWKGAEDTENRETWKEKISPSLKKGWDSGRVERENCAPNQQESIFPLPGIAARFGKRPWEGVRWVCDTLDIDPGLSRDFQSPAYSGSNSVPTSEDHKDKDIGCLSLETEDQSPVVPKCSSWPKHGIYTWNIDPCPFGRGRWLSINYLSVE